MGYTTRISNKIPLDEDQLVIQDAMKQVVFGLGDLWDQCYSACLEAFYAANSNEDAQGEVPATQNPKTGSIKQRRHLIGTFLLPLTTIFHPELLAFGS